MKDVEGIAKEIDHLKPIPEVANKVLSIVEDPQSSMAELSEIVVYDQALTANLLRTCNSAYFGLPQKVESVHKAIVYLGTAQVVDLVLMNVCASNLKERQDGYDLDQGELWRYSVSSALIARDLTEKKNTKDNHLIFTAALLKDIGKVVLSQYVAESFEEINRLVNDQGLSFREAEKAVIGIDHAELGAMVAEKWNFSPRLAGMIRNHHLSQTSPAPDYKTCIVYLADALCMMMGLSVGSDGLHYRFHQEVVEQLGFSEKDIQRIMVRIPDKLQNVEELINNA
jgi:putative nucleotidyltransferase with HDIG domain